MGGEGKCALMETAEAAIARTGAFGEYHHRVALLGQSSHLLLHGIEAHADGQEVEAANHGTIECIAPLPLVGHHHQTGRKHE